MKPNESPTEFNNTIDRLTAINFCNKCQHMHCGGFTPRWEGTSVPVYCGLSKKVGSGSMTVLGMKKDNVIYPINEEFHLGNGKLVGEKSSEIKIPQGCPYELDFLMLREKNANSNTK